MILKLLKQIINLLSSFKVAYIVLILLLVLTFLGTLEQADHGIYEVKQKYFNSVFLVHSLFDRIPIPLPGGGLLMVLLFFNLLVGSILRISKNMSRAGLLIVHFGIGFLLVSGFITFLYSFEGHLTLFENQQSDQFQSYNEWELVISEFLENGQIKDYLISDQSFADLKPGQSSEFRGAGLPFTVRISHSYKNCRPLPKGPMFEVNVPVIEGYFLSELPPEKEAERNVPGMVLTLAADEISKSHQAILWGMQRYPWTTMIDGKHWSISLRSRQWNLPFTIHLDKFTRELHPRTGIAKVFMSDVTKIENGISQALKITMNEPLRHKGYTLFQASWGPANAKPGEPLFSTFAVVKNPADKFPEYACIIIAFGLLVHFSQKLFRYIKLQNRKTA